VSPFFRKFFGISLILIAMIGMVFSAFGVAGTWIVRKSALTSLDEATELLITTLETTSDGLLVVDDSLNAATGTLSATAQTTETMAQTLVEISSLANGIVGIVNLIGGGIEAPEPQNTDLATDVQTMTANLNQVSSSLVEAQQVVDNYQLAVDNAITQLETIQQNGPTWITIAAVVLTIMLIWLAIAQVGLLLQGAELVRRK
jgi:methyl-accepting chemotaxis protein